MGRRAAAGRGGTATMEHGADREKIIMLDLSYRFIREQLADITTIFQRGRRLDEFRPAVYQRTLGDATGQRLSPLAEDQKGISVDGQTVEVTMKFKLPGF